jgi:hypothetical protein
MTTQLCVVMLYIASVASLILPQFPTEKTALSENGTSSGVRCANG